MKPPIKTKDKSLRLEGLHMEMRFLGAVGQLMGGTGVLRIVRGAMHADTVVCHILTGKAISRPILGHILIEAVLYPMILSKIYKAPL